VREVKLYVEVTHSLFPGGTLEEKVEDKSIFLLIKCALAVREIEL